MAKNHITVLGINDGHDASAAIVRDGIVLAAEEEERPRNSKHYFGVPEISIRDVMRISGVDPSEIDAIALVSLNRLYDPNTHPRRLGVFEIASPIFSTHRMASMYVKLAHSFRELGHLEEALSKVGIRDKEVVFVEHHVAHAAVVYRSSPWDYAEPTLVLTADAAGDGVSSTVNLCKDGRIERLAWSTFYHSLGATYSELTRYLGMKPSDHEYKVMGLAPYGNPETCIGAMRSIVNLKKGNPLEFENSSGRFMMRIQPKLAHLLQGQRFDNVAAAIQRHFEDLTLAWVRAAVEKTGVRKVAFTGGNFLNVKSNMTIVESGVATGTFFYPACGDDGTCIGAALQAYWEFCVRDGVTPSKSSLADLYFGRSFSEEEIANAMKKHGYSLDTRYSGIDEVIGELISKGKTVGRVDGRLEFGPRALGNRSIVADPRDLRVIQKINQAIKHRDFWMPFAPSILEERQGDYLVNPDFAPYMIMAFNTKPRAYDDLVAGLHPFDRTARPQTVNEWNRGYQTVLKTFEAKTGVGGVLNTSYNLHGYPLSYGPEEAIWTFENSGLDHLALGPFLLSKTRS